MRRGGLDLVGGVAGGGEQAAVWGEEKRRGGGGLDLSGGDWRRGGKTVGAWGFGRRWRRSAASVGRGGEEAAVWGRRRGGEEAAEAGGEVLAASAVGEILAT
ncbi:hypothetical protein OsJ_14183 [Oryza sativa Japonica Group]|uniref:Uncharacterized protein n=1 Tax=Oryza sativa subsp. japonica TaxID=39947 RepID=B9FEB3_ORYSJ|nr:hypothetical protein OsJ_14183 [Oryza sativa Japonica Group]